MGMIVANRVSLQRGLLAEDFVLRAEEILLQIIDARYNRIFLNSDIFIDAIRKDKKQTSSAITVILMNREEKLIVVHDLTTDEINNALEVLRQRLCV